MSGSTNHASEALRAIADIRARELSFPTLVRDLSLQLARVVPFDACGWLRNDPDTILSLDAISIDEPWPGELAVRFCANEYLEDDFMKFGDLARARRRAASLGQATRGEPTASRRYRELLEPSRIVDELRAALVVDGACWGSLVLYRAHPAPAFSALEVDRLAGLSATFGRALSQLAPRVCAPSSGADTPGAVLVDPNGKLEVLTESATTWLQLVDGSEHAPHGYAPQPVMAVATRARSGSGASLRMQTAYGVWVTLHGALRQPADAAHGQVLVIFDRSTAGELLPVVARRYGLSRRERDVVGCILRGLSTRQIGADLQISGYTVEDYLKSIFDKTGVHSRHDLALRLALDEGCQREKTP